MALTFLHPITHNLPFFIREPATAIIGEKCYNTLIYDADIFDADCLRFALSKALGLGIVLGGAILKLPQIAIILRGRSARGLDFTAHGLETVAYSVSLAYAAQRGYAFSTYGENAFLAAQNVVILFLILYYRPVSPRALALYVLALLLAGAALFAAPLPLLATLFNLSIPLSLSSKVPQILANHRARSTGQLSAFAVFNQLGGCLARVFTSVTEAGGDTALLLSFVGAAVLNCVIAWQMVKYWGQGQVGPEDGVELESVSLGSESSKRNSLRKQD